MTLVQRYEQLAEVLLREPGVSRGTMMGFPCLRHLGRFFASMEPKTGALILKLPAERIRELLDERVGQPFAPNGRVFREWLLIPIAQEQRWGGLAREAHAFAVK